MRWIFGVMAVIGLGTPELAWAESLAQTELCEFMNQETTRRSQWQQSQIEGIEFELPTIKEGWVGANHYESWTKSQWKANHIDPNPLDDIQELQGLKSAHTLLSYVDNPWEKMDQNVKEVLSSLYQRSQSLHQSKGLVRQVLKKHGCSSDVVDQYTTSEITSSTVLPELAEQIDPALKTPNWFENQQLGSLSEGIKDKLLKLSRTAAWDKSEYNAPCAQALQTAETICSGLVGSEQVYFFLQTQQENNKRPTEKLAADSGEDSTRSANNPRADNTNRVTVCLPSSGTSPSGDANYAKFSFHNVKRFEQYGWPKMLKGIHRQVRDCKQIRRQTSCNLRLAMRDLNEIRDHQLQDSRFSLNLSTERTYRRANFDQGLPHCYIKTPECMGRIDQHLKKSGYDGGLDEFCQFQTSPADICGPLQWTENGPRRAKSYDYLVVQSDQFIKDLLDSRSPEEYYKDPVTTTIVAGGVIGGVAGGVSAGLNSNWDPESIGKGILVGSATGALTVMSAGTNFSTAIIAGGFLSGGSDVIHQIWIEREETINLGRTAKSVLVGGIAGGVAQGAGNLAYHKTKVLHESFNTLSSRQALNEVLASATTSASVAVGTQFLEHLGECRP